MTLTIAAALGSSAIAVTNDRSILLLSLGYERRELSDV